MRSPPEVLIVEDNPGDAKLIVKSFQQVCPSAHLRLVADGDAALAYLRQQEPYRQAPRPDLMLVDLNLPRRDGRELLAEIKTDADLRLIPILVISSSEAEIDVLTAYQLRANCYLTKPLTLDEFLGTLECAAKFWLTAVRLPPRH